MMVLLETDEGLRMSELGAELNIDASNVSRLCARMEEEGHVVRRPSPEDGRVKRVHLTDEGARLARRIDEASLERFERLAETLEQEGEERERVLDVLASLNNALHTAFHEEETNES
jgi:DNA-binding MarR family transcriptional regulator